MGVENFAAFLAMAGEEDGDDEEDGEGEMERDGDENDDGKKIFFKLSFTNLKQSEFNCFT